MVASGLVLPRSGRATGLWPSWISYSCFLLPLFLLGLLHPWKPLEPNTHGVNHSGGFTAISFWTPLGQGWAFLSIWKLSWVDVIREQKDRLLGSLFWCLVLLVGITERKGG